MAFPMAMIFCGHCGESAAASERFCVACGGKLRLPADSGTMEAVSSLTAGVTLQAASDDVLLSIRPSQEDAIALRHAVDLLAKGDAKTAKLVLLRLTEEQPQWAVARAYLGIACMRLTEVAEARFQLEKAVAAAPESFICRSRYAELLARLGFYDKAMRELDIALDLGAPDSDSRYAAMELHQFCKGKAKGMFYRELAYPKLNFKRAWPFRRAGNTAHTQPIQGEG